jgi:hypothetical protein
MECVTSAAVEGGGKRNKSPLSLAGRADQLTGGKPEMAGGYAGNAIRNRRDMINNMLKLLVGLILGVLFVGSLINLGITPDTGGFWLLVFLCWVIAFAAYVEGREETKKSH